jgi:cell division septation protein DedD
VLIGALLITIASFSIGYFFGFRVSGSPEQEKQTVESAKTGDILPPEEKRVIELPVKDAAGKPVTAQSAPANQPEQSAGASAQKPAEAPATQAKGEIPKKSQDTIETSKKPEPQKIEVSTAAVAANQVQDNASVKSSQPAQAGSAASKSGRHSGEKVKKKARNAVSSGKLYTVQVGAFPSKEGADQLYQNLKAKNYNPYIVNANGSSDYFKVRVGTFKDKKAAEKSAAALSKKTGLQNFVTAAQ